MRQPLDSIELIRLAQKGDKSAREKVIVDNMALVWSIVKRFTNRGYEAEDLFQIGSIGLMKAIDKFDTGYDVKLSTYAVPMIIGEIKRFIRDDGIVKISRSIKENNMRINQAKERLQQLTGREASIEELEKETGIPKEDIITATEALKEPEYIDREEYRVNMIGKEDDKEEVINRVFLEKILSELREDERKLIDLRFYQEKTQVEVARCMGISQVQVSRAEKKILLKLRKIAR